MTELYPAHFHELKKQMIHGQTPGLSYTLTGATPIPLSMVLSAPVSKLKILNTNVPTITHEIKYGRNMTDCVTLRNAMLFISVIKMASTIASACDVIRLSRLYRMVLRVISQPVPDWNKYLKFSNPFQALPKTPRSNR